MSRIVVADLYQLGEREGKYTKEFKTIVRAKVKVQEDYAERISENWKDTGKIYIVDEKETEEWNFKMELQAEKRASAKTIKDATNSAVLTNALVNVVTQAQVEKVKKGGRPKKSEE